MRVAPTVTTVRGGLVYGRLADGTGVVLDGSTGDDLVPDTPPAEDANYGKPNFPHISCSNGPSGDMFVNYMDYVDDDTMFMFTAGQVSRMRAALDGPRHGLVK